MFPIEEGMQAWEIIAAAGVCAVAWLTVTSTFAFTLAWFLTRERAPAKVVVVPQAQPQPVPVPAYAAPTAA